MTPREFAIEVSPTMMGLRKQLEEMNIDKHIYEWMQRYADIKVKEISSKVLVSGSFSVQDMLGFAHYLRNGLTNLEYCEKEHEEHLVEWQKNYR